MKHICTKILAMLLVVAMIAGVLPFAFAANVGPFTDVKDTDWFASNVQYVYDNGLMNGTTTTTFEPESNLTRAQTAMVLWRIAGQPAPTAKAPFTDLVDAWYRDAIAWAAEQKVVNGRGDGTFDPAGFITREELVTMIWRYAGEVASEQDLSSWPDAADVYDYATGAMKWAVETGIINGMDGKLAPKGNATRAQFAKILTVWYAMGCIDHEYVNGVCVRCGDRLASDDEIVIYYTNDVHTYIEKSLSYDNIADLKEQTASVAKGVLLVDAGDHIQGTAYGAMDKGETIMQLMKASNYDLATLGNHEFDYGMARALEITDQSKYGVPYVSCNFYHEKDGVKGEQVLDSYKVFEVGGKKIAFIGITTPESFTKSTPAYFQDENGNYIYGIDGGTDGKALYTAVQNAIDAAEKEGVDYIIALGHCGDDPSSKPWTSEEVIANTTGLDAFIDGHSHSTVPMREVKDASGETVVLTQTGSYFDAVGRMSITDKGIETGLMTGYKGSDAEVKAIKDAWMAKVNEELGQVIGHADVTLDNYADGSRLVRKQETNTGDFAADALYYQFDKVQGLDVDIAVMNGGGVRNKAITGDLTYLSCKDIHTFGNVACLIEVTGQQILDALEWGAKDADAAGTKECGGFLQVAGATYEIHTYIPSTVQKDEKGVWTGGPTGEYRVKNVMIGGEPLDLNKTYRLAGYNYTLRDLGDGFAMFNGAENVLDYVKEDYMVLADYVLSFPKDETTGLPTIKDNNGVYGADYSKVTGEGRITLVNEKPDAPTEEGFILTDTLNAGDKVIIFNNAENLAMGPEVYAYTSSSSGKTKNELVAVSGTVDGNKLTAEGAAVLTVTLYNDHYVFANEEGKYLEMDGNNVQWADEIGAYTLFDLEQAEGGFFIKSTNATYYEKAQYIELYKGYYTCYGMNASNTSIYTFNFYKETGAGEPAPAATVEAKVPSTLRDGAEIPAYITTPKGYKADGSFPFVVMIHGHGGNHNEWGGFDTISNGLAEQGFVVATLDFPGCDKSTESFQLNTMTNMKADVLDVIDYVCKNYAVDETRIGAFGYSMGGRITLELLAEGKYDFSTIELVAPAEDLTDLKGLFGGAEKWETMKAEANEKGYVEYTTIYGQTQQLSKEWFADLEKYSDGLVEKAAENYTGDSLVIWATNDEAVSPSVSSAVATTLGSATLNTYADGHSYSFYGKDEYTISTVNNGSVNYFVDELKNNETRIHGYVQSIAKYGNLELTIPGSELDKAGFEYGDLLKITVDGKEFSVPYGTNYSDVDQGSTILRNSDGHLTLAINMGDFAGKNGIATKKTNADKTYEWYYADETNVPAVVTIEMGEKGGYYDEWLIHQLVRTNNREDYADLSDAEFANFRNVTTTGMGTNALYRSSSPINPEIGRNTYADKAAEAAGIKTFMNLANDEATAKGYEGFDSTYYSKQNVVYLNLGVDFTAADFKTGLATGLRYFTTHEGPYLVHCTEGKDRAGFVSALLECYMGATYDEVVADYMVTYYNYYGVTKEAEAAKYDAIVRSNIVKTLQTAFGVEDLKTADLKQEATDFFKELGLTESELNTLSENLSKPYGVETPKITVNAVTDIDKYGDMRLSITSGDFKKLGYDYADLVTVKFQDQELVLPVVPDYRYVAAQGAAIVVWKDDTKPVEVEIYNGSFAGYYGLATKTKNDDGSWFWTANEGVTFPVEFTFAMSEKNGYRDEYAIFDLQRTNERSDYADLTDAQFANFRNVTTTGMGKNALYRSSSPINPEIGRNTYADKAAEAAGVKTFMNLADNQTAAEAYAGYADTYYSKQNVIFLGLGVDFTTEQNRTGLAEGLRYFTTHEGPYLVHCNEGQDRAGFTAAVLECYMGATYDEVVADYMTTFSNYYGVKTGTEQYTVISNNIVKNLKTAFGVEDLTTANLKQEATDYFKELGLTDAELATLTANLSKEYAGGSTEPETKSYVKVTAAPEDWTGTYLIVNEADETSAYVFNGKDAVNGYVSATIANGKITSSTELDAVAVTIEKTTDGYALKVNGQYIYGVSGSNTLKFTDTAASAVNTITLSDTDGVIITSNTSVLRFNAASNQLRFRYYKSSSYANQQAIQLYKLEG